jgi:hypothetical protein
MGTDIPDITAGVLAAAAAALSGGAEAVLGPAKDGGYYCVGSTQPMPAMFHVRASARNSHRGLCSISDEGFCGLKRGCCEAEGIGHASACAAAMATARRTSCGARTVC